MLRLPPFVVLFSLILSAPVLAQDVPAPPNQVTVQAAPSPIAQFFGQFLTPTGIASAVVTLLGLVGGALGLSTLRKRQIAIITQHAFHAVEDIAATTETPIDDKVAAGLKVADEWMKAQGWRPLSPGEAEVVKLGFSALNGATKVAEKVAEAAAPVPSKP